MYAWYHCIMFCLTTLRFAWQPNWFNYEGITLEAVRPIFDPNILLYFYTSISKPLFNARSKPVWVKGAPTWVCTKPDSIIIESGFVQTQAVEI